jgi:flagellar biosynthesis/type III secretory pathway chaperone
MLTLLKEILHEEINTVKSLLNLLEEQHSYLVNQEVFNLDGIIPKIEESCKLVAASESKRRKLVGNKSMNLIVDEFKDIELKELHEKLLGLLQEASVQKESNDLLIKQSLSYTNSMLNMLKPRKETNTYNGYGKLKR